MKTPPIQTGSKGLYIYIRKSRRNRTLHLYEVIWPTNLLVFGFSRANAETSHSMRMGAGGSRDVAGSKKFSHGIVRSQKLPLTVLSIVKLRMRTLFH